MLPLPSLQANRRSPVIQFALTRYSRSTAYPLAHIGATASNGPSVRVPNENFVSELTALRVPSNASANDGALRAVGHRAIPAHEVPPLGVGSSPRATKSRGRVISSTIPRRFAARVRAGVALNCLFRAA